MKSNYYYLGVVVGIIFGLLLVAVSMRLMKKDSKQKNTYDERQEAIRGKAYKYGFFTLVFLTIGIGICDDVLSKYFESMILHYLVVVISILVFAITCIFKEAYLSLNEKPKRVLAVFSLLGVVNLLGGGAQCAAGKAFKDGKLLDGSLNLFTGILFIVLTIMMAVKFWMDKKEEA
jgi:zinc transporter ZupT